MNNRYRYFFLGLMSASAQIWKTQIWKAQGVEIDNDEYTNTKTNTNNN